MNVGFLSYLRQSVRKQATVIIIITAIFGLSAFILSRIGDLEQIQRDQRRQYAAFWLAPACIIFISFLAQIKCGQHLKEQMTESITFIYILTHIGVAAALNAGFIVDEVSSDMRKQQIFSLFLCYFLSVTFMAVSYLPHLICRVFLVIAIIMLLLYRARQGDDVDVATSLVIAFGLVTIGEVNLYLNHKAKAILFVEIKVNEKQQQQLRNLLNTVPDNVLICTQSLGDVAPKSIYANSKIEDFFKAKVD